MKKAKVKMKKPVYLGLSILEICNTLMYETWYKYIKPKYQCNSIKCNVKLCFMGTDNFIMHSRTKHVHE